jgi:hypothetical protein
MVPFFLESTKVSFWYCQGKIQTRTSQTAPAAIRSLQFHVQNPLVEWKNVVLLLDYLISPVTSCTIPRFWLVLESISVAAVAFVGLSHLLSGWNKLPSIKSTWLPWLEDYFPLKIANSQGQTANLGDGRTIEKTWNYPKLPTYKPRTSMNLLWFPIKHVAKTTNFALKCPPHPDLLDALSQLSLGPPASASSWSKMGYPRSHTIWVQIVNIGKL